MGQVSERISIQYDKYGFNPYEEEISEEQQMILQNDTTFKPIFPYTIKKFRGSGFKELTDDIFTYPQYLGYTSDPPVRVVQPQGIPEELSLDAITEYDAVLREILDTEFFVEDVDFYYKNFQFEDLKQWLIKGIWYFDKKYSELIYRPIGLPQLLLLWMKMKQLVEAVAVIPFLIQEFLMNLMVKIQTVMEFLILMRLMHMELTLNLRILTEME